MTPSSLAADQPRNGSARSLAMLGPSCTLAGHHLVAAVSRAAGDVGLPVLLLPSDQTEPDRETLTTVVPGQLVGLIVIIDSAGRITIPNSLQPVPTVDIDLTGEAGLSAQIRIDRAGSAARLVDHVRQLGHRRIGYLGPPASTSHDQWQRALARELIVADLFDPEYFLAATADAAGGRSGAARLLGLAPRPTAIICRTGRMAMGVYRAADEAGVPIPGELSVVAVEDTDVTPDGLRPTLDAVHIPHLQIGAQAVRMVLDLAQGRVPPPAALICDVIPRASSAPVPTTD